MSKSDLKSLSPETLSAWVREKGMPAYRAVQIRDWLSAGVTDFSKMSNLPLSLREALAADFAVTEVKVERKLISALDGTVKYLFSLPDGETVESVLMSYKHGYSQCISISKEEKHLLRYKVVSVRQEI